MEYKNISLVDVVESFLTGICCLVGGDQLYLFISQTKANPYNQYHVLLFISAFTFTISFIFYDEYNEDFMNAVQLLYVTILLCLVLILYSRIRSVTIVTLCTIFLSIVLTIFVLSCCISYSINRVLLLTFILGLFGSRLLPTLCWIFIDDKYPDIDTQLTNFTLKLYFVRFMLCLLSIIRKIVNNNFGLSIHKIRKLPYEIGPFRPHGFVSLFENLKMLFKNVFYSTDVSDDDFSYFYIFSLDSYIPILPIVPYFCFFSSFILISLLPPAINLRSYEYLNHKLYYINNLKTASHFFGILLGIKYPLSITVYSLSFSIMYFLYIIYIISIIIIYRHFKALSDFLINILVTISGIFLGYISSYSLGVIYNTTLGKTCIYEDYNVSCCGDKSRQLCYCMYKKIINDINIISYSEKRLYCEKPFGGYNILKYSSNANNAILILYNNDESNLCKDIKCCTETCSSTCTGSSCKCLKLLGIYKLDTITTSSCSDCQLTVRIEGENVCSHISSDTGGARCRCNGSLNCKCCCLAVGCCGTTSGCTQNKCCCVKICCCKICNGGGCQCKTSTSNDVRIFFGYKTKEKCCIKEIKPNENPKFDGSLGKQNEFYIGGISIRNCCHVDLQVDLQCYMKNSFYRITGVNYNMKYLNIESIIFTRENGDCCTGSCENKCCCCDVALVRLCIKYKHYPIFNDPVRDKLNKCELNNCAKQCNTKCGCCTHTNGQKCCCCKSFTLNTSIRSSFYKRMEPVRIKLSIIFLFLLMSISLIPRTIVSENINKKSKQYDFNQMISYEIIYKSTKKYIINSIESINKRLNINTNETSKTSNNTAVKDKSEDLKNMLKLFNDVLDEKSFNELNKYIIKQTDEHIKKSKTNISKDDIMWSYCIGLMYSYVIEMYLKLQTYFIRWEFVWKKEYFNYLKSIDSTFSNITNQSKCGISIISELNLKEKTPYCVTKDRTISFNNTYDELNRYIDINENETKCNQELPSDIDSRLKYFIDRWDNRINTIEYLINNDSNIFNWDQFIGQYPFIQEWLEMFYPYLQQASNEVQIPEKKFNMNLPLTMVYVI